MAPLFVRAAFHTWRARRAGPCCGDPNRVLYLASFWPGNAGYEYRVARWADVLRDAGFDVDIDCAFEHEQFWSWVDDNDPRLYVDPARHRLQRILDSRGYGTVIVAREILLWNDYGNLFLERLLLQMHPNAILDIDDDLGAAKREPRRIGRFGRLLREHPAKFTASLQMYQRVIAGSGYLKELVLSRAPARQANHVAVIPTCLDYEDVATKRYEDRSGPILFGWIGGTGNLGQLELVTPALRKLSQEFPLRLLVISGREYSAPGLDVENVPWDIDTYIEQLRRADIGLMPLYDTIAAKGKCGFKLLQYMGLGIVGVATAITVNNEIITDGVNGFLVPPDDNWEAALRRVLASRERFPEIGRAARTTVLSDYSIRSHRESYVEFVRAGARRAGPGPVSGASDIVHPR